MELQTSGIYTLPASLCSKNLFINTSNRKLCPLHRHNTLDPIEDDDFEADSSTVKIFGTLVEN